MDAICGECKEKYKKIVMESFEEDEDATGELLPDKTSACGGCMVEIPYRKEGGRLKFHGEAVKIHYCMHCGKRMR
jgi:hypothetical protein